MFSESFRSKMILIVVVCCIVLPVEAAASVEYGDVKWVHRDEFKMRFSQLEKRLTEETNNRHKLEIEITKLKTKMVVHDRLQQTVESLRTELGHWKSSHKRLRTIVRRQWTAIYRQRGLDRALHRELQGDAINDKKGSMTALAEHNAKRISKRSLYANKEKQYLKQKQPRQLSEDATTDRVAFTVELQTGELRNLGLGQPIKFDHIISNLGNGYDLRSGLFTVRVPGWYVLTLTIMIHGDSNMEIWLVKDGELVAKCWGRQNGDPQWEQVDSITQSTVVHLTPGNIIWVQTNPTLLLSQKIVGDKHSRFTGFLLYKD